MCSFARSVRPSVGRSVGRSTPPPPRGGRRRRRRSDPVRSGPIGSGARARLPQSLVTSFGSRLPSALAAAAARGREAALPRAARVLHPEVELNKTVRSISRLARPTRSTRPFLTKMPIPPSVCTCRTRVRSHESATVPTREHGREQKKTLRLLRQPTSDQLLSTYIVRAGDLSAYASCLCIIRFSDRSKARRRCRHAAETSHGSSARRSDAGYGRKKFSPRTDLDDRPTLGGKTPPSPGRRVPVDSPEDRRFSNRSKSHRRCRHAMETSQGRSDGRSDAGYGRKKFSPRTDLDDRPTLGGKTPPSPGRRVPVDSPEDRRFSNRSKSHRRCRHAMETSHGRSDGRSDAGYGSRVRLGTVGEAPHCGSRTPDFAVFLVRDSAKDYRRDANAGRRPPLAVSCRRRHRLWDAGDRVSISRRKKISPRTDLDDRPRLGGKTPPSPGRRVPVDSPEDRRFSNRSKSHRRCRHAMDTSHGRSDGRSDAGYGSRVRLGTVGEAPHCGSRTPDFAVFLVRDSAKDYRRDANAGRRPPLAVSCRRRHRLWDAGDRVSISRRKKFSPRTDLDDRPMLGGKTPPSPGRRVPVDSPEDRRFSNRSKSHRRCRHAMETSQGRSDGRSDAGYGRKKFSPRTDLDDRPTLGGKTPPSPGRRVPVDSPEDRRFSNRSKSRRRCRHAMETSHGRSDGRSDADYGGRVRLGTAGDAPTGFRKNRVNGGSSYDSRTCVYVSSDFHIGKNRVADAGTRRKLRTDVPTDVPKPAMAAGSDSERWGKLLTVGVALRTLPFFWYGIPQKTTGATQTPAGDRRLRSRAGAGTGYGTQATASRYLEENFFLLEPTSTTGRRSAARPRPRPGDACRSIAPRTDVSQIGPNRIAVAGTPWKLRTDVPTDVPTPVMEEKNFLLEPTSTTGRRSAARPRPRPGDACRSIAPRTDVSQIGPNRIAVAGTPWKLRTDVPTDVPTPTMAAGSDSERRGMLLREARKNRALGGSTLRLSNLCRWTRFSHR